jgi:hypothetical protein
MRTFYIVMECGNEVPAKGGSCFAHHMTKKSAVNEAQRLSRLNRFKKYRVFEAIGQAKNEGKWHDAEGENTVLGERFE